jgi:hypothetical protein
VPAAARNLAPWFYETARNACSCYGGQWGEDRFRNAMRSLRTAVLAGQPLEDADDVGYMLDMVAQDAHMWRNSGATAYARMSRSLRNMVDSADNEALERLIAKLIAAGVELTPQALRHALVTKYGPAADLLFQGIRLVFDGQDSTEQLAGDQPVGSLQLILESGETAPVVIRSERFSSIRRMTLGFR